MQAHPGKFSGQIDCLKHIVKEEGLKGIFRWWPLKSFESKPWPYKQCIFFSVFFITSSRGSFVTLARDIPAFSSYFMTYELLRERFKESDGSLGLGSTAVIGGLSGVVGWAVEIPLDALKSRHQGCLRYDTRKRPFMKSYSNFFSRKRPLSATIREVWHEGGPRILFRGSGVILLRAIPANSVTFIGYEWTMKALVLLSYETVTSD